jgi:hypothetical protein
MHYPPSALTQSLATWRPAFAHEEADLVAHMRSLVITDGKAAVAKRLGLTEFRLTGILRGRWPVPEEAAKQLGYRRIVRFERID